MKERNINLPLDQNTFNALQLTKIYSKQPMRRLIFDIVQKYICEYAKNNLNMSKEHIEMIKKMLNDTKE